MVECDSYLDWWPASIGRRLDFQKAAEALAQVMLDAHHSDRDTLVYPWLMCWRHYVELQLKYILQLCERILDKPLPPPEERNHHRILDLWRELAPMLDELRPGDSPNEVKIVDRLIKELSRVDPDSMHTRYPVTTKGRPTMEVKGLQSFNVVAVHEAMSGMAGFFDGVESAIEADDEVRSIVLPPARRPPSLPGSDDQYRRARTAGRTTAAPHARERRPRRRQDDAAAAVGEERLGARGAIRRW